MKTTMIRTPALSLLAAPGLAQAADPMKGMIVSHDGQTIVVRANGTDTPIMLTDTTKIRGATGALGATTTRPMT